MPGMIVPSVPHHPRPAPTTEELEYAELPVIDLSKGATPAGRATLAAQLCDAMTTVGFFYVINHGMTQAQNDRLFDIADVPFTQMDEHEKKLYEGNPAKTGTYEGFKARKFWHLESGVFDQVEHYNIHRDVYSREHPQALRPLLPEVDDAVRFVHFDVVHPILRLMAVGMGLPEETLVEQHKFDAAGHTSLRFMNYPRSEEEETKTKNVWLKGHTDIGSISVLWSQPIAALQLFCPDQKWRWVKHIDNALVINAGDAMEYLSGGFYKATIHRVVQPPADQRNLERLGVFYFSMPDDDVKLVPHLESPALQEVGVSKQLEGEPTMEAWRKARSATYGLTQLKKREDGHEEEVIEGRVVTHYN